MICNVFGGTLNLAQSVNHIYSFLIPINIMLSSSLAIDNIWALVIVWRIRVNIIRTVLCCIVYCSYAQSKAHSYKQFPVFMIMVVVIVSSGLCTNVQTFQRWLLS